MFTTFYHGITKKITASFGTLFNNIYIERGQGNTYKKIKVPLTYSPKERMMERLNIELDDPKAYAAQLSLPRMSFMMTNFEYDTERKKNSIVKRKIEKELTNGDVTINYHHAEVPYKLGYSVYVYSRAMDDGLKIVEQILPFFTPHYNLTVNLNTQMGYKFDVPTVLNNVTLQDDYDGLFEQRRVVLYTLTFTMKTQMFGPITESEVIRTVQANIKEVKQDELGNDVVARRREFTASVDPITTSVGTSPIPTSEEWNFDF